MAQQSSRRRGSAAPAARRFVMASVRLDVATHARVSAAAALAGLDKSAWMARAITDALQGVVVIDRRKAADHGDLSGGGISAKSGGPVHDSAPDSPD